MIKCRKCGGCVLSYDSIDLRVCIDCGARSDDKKEGKKMLEFEKEELSLQLVAYSETTPFKSYWIDEGAWTHLTIVRGTPAGPICNKPMPFFTVEDAMAYANEQE